MGKVTGGILGDVRGKVGAVVGGAWKGIPYVRLYTVPSPSNTPAQVAQRERFAFVVSGARNFLATILNPYVDKFTSGQSAFNRFVQNNIPKAPAFTALTNYKVAEGTLFPAIYLDATYNTSTGATILTWPTDLGVDGSATDRAVVWARHIPTNYVYFGTPVARSAGTATIAADPTLLPSEMDCGVFFAKMLDDVPVKISDSTSTVATAP